MNRSVLWSFWAPTAILPPPATVKAVPTLARDSAVDANRSEDDQQDLGEERHLEGTGAAQASDVTATMGTGLWVSGPIRARPGGRPDYSARRLTRRPHCCRRPSWPRWVTKRPRRPCPRSRRSPPPSGGARHLGPRRRRSGSSNGQFPVAGVTATSPVVGAGLYSAVPVGPRPDLSEVQGT